MVCVPLDGLLIDERSHHIHHLECGEGALCANTFLCEAAGIVERVGGDHAEDERDITMEVEVGDATAQCLTDDVVVGIVLAHYAADHNHGTRFHHVVHDEVGRG